MNFSNEMLELLKNKQLLSEKLDSIYYGSIEIREKNSNKYIYVHFREKGLPITKYVGEYSEELHNLILKNNLESKKIKKEIKLIEKNLKELGYINEKLSEKVKNNIDFARKHIAQSIYKQASLEGINTTFSDTQEIIEGGMINNMSSMDVQKILNLKYAWEFVLNENVILSRKDFNILSQINKFVLEHFFFNAGQIRSVPVSIGGTKYQPKIPIESDVKQELEEILNLKVDDETIAVELVLYIMKKQIFIDGNKRCAIIFANHFLISKGIGLITVPVELIEEYKKLLVKYYEGNNEIEIKRFLKEKCIIRI